MAPSRMAAREVRPRATVLPSPTERYVRASWQRCSGSARRAAVKFRTAALAACCGAWPPQRPRRYNSTLCPRTTATMSKVSFKITLTSDPKLPFRVCVPLPGVGVPRRTPLARRIAPGGESPRHLFPIAHVVTRPPSAPQAERHRGGALHRGAQVRGRGVQGSRGNQRHHHQRCASLPSRVPRRAVHAHSALTRCPPRFTSPLLAQTASASTPARRAGTCSLSTAASFA